MNTTILAITLVAIVAAAIWQAPKANWDMALFAILLAFSVFSDMTSIETESGLKITASFLALVTRHRLLRRDTGGVDRGQSRSYSAGSAFARTPTTCSSTC